MSKKCPVCSALTYGLGRINGRNAFYINCFRCGEFVLTDKAFTLCVGGNPLNDLQIANLSGWLREHQRVELDSTEFKKLRALPTPTVDEKAVKLLKYFANKYPVAGEYIDIGVGRIGEIIEQLKGGELQEHLVDEAKNILPLLSISWTQNSRELGFIITEYLIKKHGYIKNGNEKQITPDGWAFLQSLKRVNPDSQIGFIAMWFDKTMDTLLFKIEEAIERAGYKPKRVDRHEHVNRIDDEIISLIRQSKFIVADYTGQRSGVYFESGYALGMGLPVIWLCREEEKDNLHFDTRQYNFIFWKSDRLDQLITQVERRIIAVIGRGTVSDG